MGAVEIGAFLSHLAGANHVAASTQNQALNALIFLYAEVWHLDIGDLGQFVRAKRSSKVPVVLAKEEVNRLLVALTDTPQLMAGLLYGTGMRLSMGLSVAAKTSSVVNSLQDSSSVAIGFIK